MVTLRLLAACPDVSRHVSQKSQKDLCFKKEEKGETNFDS